MSRGTESDVCKNVLQVGSSQSIYDREQHLYETLAMVREPY
jgi:hypothetical protein